MDTYGPPLRNHKVEQYPVGQLIPQARNPRTHSRQQVRQIADSIQAFGFTNPILIDDQNQIIAGHGRVEAAKLLGHDTVPTIRLEDMTKAQIRAYVIADNKLAENAGWDEEILAGELQYLSALDLDFDVTLTGFEAAAIDLLIEGLEAQDDSSAADLIPETPPDEPLVSRPGDLWQLGEHRLLCGDATSLGSFRQLLGSKKAQLVFTDPPYNVPIDGHVCGLGAIKHGEFPMASGEMSELEFTAFLNTVIQHLVTYSIDGSIHYLCMDWRHIYDLLTAARSVYAEVKNLCVWNKSNAGMGSFYRSKHELIFVFKNGTGRHVNNFELGQHGRYRTNVWDHPGVNTLRQGRIEDLAMHPTVKPVALVSDAILDCSKRKGIVLDCFAGSGTTIIAAEKTCRRAYVMELDPKYVDVAIRRWQGFTGETAIHVDSGLEFSQVKEERGPGRPVCAPDAMVGKDKALQRKQPHNREVMDVR